MTEIKDIKDCLVFQPIISNMITLPKRGTAESVGVDIYSPIDGKIAPNERLLIPSNLKCIIPKGYYLHLFPRSGLALKFGIIVMAGVIDEDYIDKEIGIILYNSGTSPYVFKKNDAICQGILLQNPKKHIAHIGHDEYQKLISSIQQTRTGGFGSTNIFVI
jgi:dUTP pyrophosphatase